MQYSICTKKCLGGHWLPFVSFLDGKHANMDSQSDNGNQQQSGNGCDHQGPNQNHASQHVERPEMQALPMPVQDPPIQYTKVSCTQQSRVKAIKAEPNVRNDPSSSLVQVSLSLEGNSAHNKNAWSTQRSI